LVVVVGVVAHGQEIMVALIPRSSGGHTLKPSRIALSASASSSSPMAPCPPYRRPYVPKSYVKGIFAGSGNAGMSSPYIAAAVVALTRRPPEDLSLLYIGTASYDIAEYRRAQTGAFSSMGVAVRSLDVANVSVPREAMAEAVDGADIILVSGGNTMYAVDRWEYLGLGDLLRGATLSGKVVTGGSAGAICWFDGGHSDSMDPETHRLFKLKDETSRGDAADARMGKKPGKGGMKSPIFEEGTRSDEETEAETDVESDEDSKDSGASDWEYIRVGGLGILPGLICPHHDRVQSNGVLRLADFRAMMERHPCEVGIGIDHFAALEIDGTEYRVLSIPGQTGSVDVGGGSGGGKVPGVWINYVDDDGIVHSKVCPRSGKVFDLLQVLKYPAKHIVVDKRVKMCRKANPPLKD
jgi:dipeptidase E